MIGYLRAEVVDYQQIAVEIFRRLGFAAVVVVPSEAFVFKVGQYILRRVIDHVEAALDHDLGNGGGHMRLSESGRAAEQQIPAVLSLKFLREFPADLEYSGHIAVLVRRLTVIIEIEGLEALGADKPAYARAFIARQNELAAHTFAHLLANKAGIAAQRALVFHR